MANQQKTAQPKVAIITRTKGHPIFLERALKSVQAQTLTDYVHVIFNDGGDEAQVNALLDRHKSTKRLVVHSAKRLGHTPALNQAIQASNSEYIAILDDDDTWAPERLEKAVTHLDKTKQKAVVVKMDIITEEIHGDKINFVSQRLHPESGEGEINLFKQCSRNYLSNGVITYRRDVYDELGGYDETLGVAEDWDFGIKLMLKYDVGFLRHEGSLFFYHQRPTQKGSLGNSVYAEVDTQEKTINLLRNRYLRADLQAGKLGVGYIMNKLVQDEAWAVRLEGHINYVAGVLRKELKEDIEGGRYVTRLVRRLKRK